MTQLLSIGELARRCGLSVSALRFYDKEGVLIPQDVDPRTGYRRYASDQVQAAIVLASLRRIGTPVAEIRAVLDDLDDAGSVASMIEHHLDRLAIGLRRAEAEVRLVFSDGGLSASWAETSRRTDTIVGDFPDYARILPDPDDAQSTQLAQLTTTPYDADLVVLDGYDVAVRHEFLLEAMEAADERATLSLDGPITPLVFRSGDGAVNLHHARPPRR